MATYFYPEIHAATTMEKITSAKESDSDSAISSGSDDLVTYAEDGQFAPGTAEAHSSSKTLSNHNQSSSQLMKVNAASIRLPFVDEEVIGTYYHPAHLRCFAFFRQHGNVYMNVVNEQSKNLVGTEQEIRSFAETWIRHRLQVLGQQPFEENRLCRIQAAYLNLLSNVSLTCARELCVISRYRANLDQLRFMESHFSYRYDPSYSSVMSTSRHAFQGFRY